MFRLHSPHLQPADVALDAGVRDLVRQPGGNWQLLAAGDAAITPAAECLLRFRLDQRGLWLAVPGPGVRVHLNGRPVSRLAFLRGGDVLHVDGRELRLVGRAEDGVKGRPVMATMVLRAHGGALHGRSVALTAPMRISGGVQPQVRPAIVASAEDVLAVDVVGEQVRLKVLDARAGVLLNGQAFEEAPLQPGDQLSVGTVQRFVLEVATVPYDEEAAERQVAAAVTVKEAPPVRTVRILPWLLLAALASAAVLAVLLLFGAR